METSVRTEEELTTATAKGCVLVDFWATWCGPCLMMGEIVAKDILPQIPSLKVVKINVDDAPELAAKFGIMSIPALFCYKNGTKCAEFVGVTTASEIIGAFF